jgi:small subunit ribosomal protein S8
MTDPIADMLTRIRNAQMARKSELVIPYSKLKSNLLDLLHKEGWIEFVKKVEPANTKSKKSYYGEIPSRFASLHVKLKYNADKTPHISQLKRISKPDWAVN